MKKTTFILFILLALSFESCTYGKLDNDEIRQIWWKFCDNEPVVGDFPLFDNTNLRNDTIYSRTHKNIDSAIAVIYNTEKRWKADDVIYIRNLRSGQIGRYCAKGNAKQFRNKHNSDN
jgi:hypothetical protein